jgi:hypothetical protein
MVDRVPRQAERLARRRRQQQNTVETVDREEVPEQAREVADAVRRRRGIESAEEQALEQATRQSDFSRDELEVSREDGQVRVEPSTEAVADRAREQMREENPDVGPDDPVSVTVRRGESGEIDVQASSIGQEETPEGIRGGLRNIGDTFRAGADELAGDGADSARETAQDVVEPLSEAADDARSAADDATEPIQRGLSRLRSQDRTGGAGALASAGPAKGVSAGKAAAGVAAGLGVGAAATVAQNQNRPDSNEMIARTNVDEVFEPTRIPATEDPRATAPTEIDAGEEPRATAPTEINPGEDARATAPTEIDVGEDADVTSPTRIPATEDPRATAPTRTPIQDSNTGHQQDAPQDSIVGDDFPVAGRDFPARQGEERLRRLNQQERGDSSLGTQPQTVQRQSQRQRQRQTEQPEDDIIIDPEEPLDNDILDRRPNRDIDRDVSGRVSDRFRDESPSETFERQQRDLIRESPGQSLDIGPASFAGTDLTIGERQDAAQAQGTAQAQQPAVIPQIASSPALSPENANQNNFEEPNRTQIINEAVFETRGRNLPRPRLPDDEDDEGGFFGGTFDFTEQQFLADIAGPGEVLRSDDDSLI